MGDDAFNFFLRSFENSISPNLGDGSLHPE
jgi:hypothetical protein